MSLGTLVNRRLPVKGILSLLGPKAANLPDRRLRASCVSSHCLACRSYWTRRGSCEDSQAGGPPSGEWSSRFSPGSRDPRSQYGNHTRPSRSMLVEAGCAGCLRGR